MGYFWCSFDTRRCCVFRVYVDEREVIIRLSRQNAAENGADVILSSNDLSDLPRFRLLLVSSSINESVNWSPYRNTHRFQTFNDVYSVHCVRKKVTPKTSYNKNVKFK